MIPAQIFLDENGEEFHPNPQVLVDRRVIEMFVRFGSLILLTNKTKENYHERIQRIS